MYLPAATYFGPVPLSVATTLAGVAVTYLWLARRQVPDYFSNVLFSTVIGAILGNKLIYIVMDPRHFWHYPGALLFTPRSSLGNIGALIGAVIGLLAASLRHKRPRTWTDLSELAMMATLLTALSGLGWNLIGAPSHLPLITITAHHVNRVASYLIWSFLEILLFLGLHTLSHRSSRLATGLFFLGTAVNWLIVGLTQDVRGHPLTLTQWTAVAMGVLGYRIMSESSGRYDTIMKDR